MRSATLCMTSLLLLALVILESQQKTFLIKTLDKGDHAGDKPKPPVRHKVGFPSFHFGTKRWTPIRLFFIWFPYNKKYLDPPIFCEMNCTVDPLVIKHKHFSKFCSNFRLIGSVFSGFRCENLCEIETMFKTTLLWPIMASSRFPHKIEPVTAVADATEYVWFWTHISCRTRYIPLHLLHPW